MLQTIINALSETLYLVLVAGFTSMVISIPLATWLALKTANKFSFTHKISKFSSSLLYLIQSLPFIMLMILFIPITNILIQEGISYLNATLCPMIFAGTLYLTQRIFNLVYTHEQKWHEFAKNLGAKKTQILKFMILPDILGATINYSCDTAAMLVGLATVAGALGAGGLGQLAIESSISNPNVYIVAACVFSVVALQLIFKYTGVLAAKAFTVQNIA